MSYTENEDLDNWLAQELAEPVIEPEMPIVDPHHHLWDIRTYGTVPYVDFRQKVYLCEELSQDIRASGHNVVKTVFAQCGAFYRASGPEAMKCVGETEFVNGIVAMSNSGLYGETQFCAGIFGSVDLRAGDDAEEVVLAHRGASPNFRGVRTGFSSELDDDFLQGYALLAKYQLSFDHYSPDVDRLLPLAKLARANTDVEIIVNHLGGTVNSKAGHDEWLRWKSGIDAISSCPNVVMKCGGAQMRVASWEPEFHMHQRSQPMGSEELCDLLFPYYEYAIQAFGPDRCMFESNFPVDRECVSYRTLWNTFKRVAARLGLSDDEKTNIFSGTASRVYRI